MIDDDFIIELDDPQTLYYAECRANLERNQEDGRLSSHTALTLLSVIAMAERNGLMLATPGEPAGFGGFGDIPLILVEFPHKETSLAPWHRVHEALEVTGATPEQYFAFKAEEEQEVVEEGGKSRFDSYRMHHPDGTSYEVPCCNWQMVMLLMLDGPWGKEFFKNMQPTFRRALVNSGLGETLGPVVVTEGPDGLLVPTGQTITEAILAQGPLPTHEEAVRAARSGPLGALLGGDR